MHVCRAWSTSLLHVPSSLGKHSGIQLFYLHLFLVDNFLLTFLERHSRLVTHASTRVLGFVYFVVKLSRYFGTLIIHKGYACIGGSCRTKFCKRVWGERFLFSLSSSLLFCQINISDFFFPSEVFSLLSSIIHVVNILLFSW